MSETAPSQSRLPEQVGNEPFVFVCYSHKDSERVYPHIEYLQRQGIGVWFDGGIRAGTLWREEIADALDRATHLVFFVSRVSLESDHCDPEVQYALDHRKTVVPVFLEDIEVTAALRVPLGRLHALYGHKVSSDALQDALRDAVRSGMRRRESVPRALPRSLIDRPRHLLWASVATIALLIILTAVWRSGILTDSRTIAPAAQAGVVVLPFENGTGRESDAYLSEGFGDELRDQLARVPGLRVVARPSSVLYRDHKQPASEIARELGVTKVVEGSLRKEGDRVRIAVRLIDGANDEQLWSESYDRKSIDLLAVQQDIALAAAQQISPKVNEAQLPKPQWQASVHDLMLLARSYQQKAVSPADWDKVVSIYQQVVQSDPDSAVAHARLAKSLLFQGKDLDGAEAHARIALDLDPDLAEGHAVLGFLLWTQFRRGAGQEYARAVELNPNDAEAQHNYGEYIFLRFREPHYEYLLRARDLDPMSLQINADLGYQYAATALLNRWAEASALMQERFPDAAGRFALSRISAAAGDVDVAIAWALEARRLDPDNEDVPRDIAEWLARLGLDAQSQKVEPEPSLRTLFWERRYEEIIVRMAEADLDQVDGDALGYLAFALQARGRDSEATPILETMGLPEIALDDDLRRWASVHHLAVLIGSLQAVGDTQQARTLAAWLAQYVHTGWKAVPDEEGSWAARWWNACALSVSGTRAEALAAFESAAAAPNLAWLPYLQDAACFRDLHNEPRYKAAIASLQARHDAIRDRLPATLAKHGFTIDQI